MTCKLKNSLLALAVAAMVPLASGEASAHAVAIGYTPGAEAGTVNLWLGSYHSDNTGDGNNLEGSAQLTGVTDTSYSSVTPFTVAFATGTPDGLPTAISFAGSYTLPQINSWEVAVVSGLTAGTYNYTYVPAAAPTQHWASYTGSGTHLESIPLNLTSADVSGNGTDVTSSDVPEPATIAILGLGLAATGIARKRSRRWTIDRTTGASCIAC